VRLVDTDILIDIQRGYLPALKWFESLAEIPHVPGFVVMELMQSAENKTDVKNVRDLIAPFTVVWPQQDDMQRALEEFSGLHLSHGIGLLDSLIAATAVGLDAQLLTFNVKHLLSRLRMQAWYDSYVMRQREAEINVQKY
jgi:predicted nucleic acid-binding protein